MRSLLLLVVVACTQAPSSSLPAVTSHVIERDIPQDSQQQLDLLFVIDDSPAMEPFTGSVVANGATFASVLATLPRHLPDLRIAVTTSDPIAGGAFHAAVDGAPFLTSTTAYDGTITANFTGSLANAMTHLFDVGTAGSTVAQPLAAAKLALATHPDFLRKDAYLAVVFIGATDDASSESLAAYADALKNTKTDPNDVVVSVVAGTGCMFHGGTAADAVRLHAFLDQFPNRSVFTTICQEDLSDGLLLVAGLFKSLLSLVCLPANLGACVASDVVDGVELGLLSECNGDELPCFRLVADPNNCVGDEPTSLIVERVVDPPRGDHLLLQCVVNE